jgi:chromate transporter
MMENEKDTQQKNVSLHEIFRVFFKVGAFTIGGGYAMIPLLQNEISKRKWIPDEELPDIIALALSAPGILAVNASIFAGYKLRGVKGSIAATIGTVLPSFVIILLIAMLLTNYADNPVVVRIFNGIRPVVVSLIAVPTINMAKKSCKTWWAWVLAIGSMLAVGFLDISPIWLLITIMAAAFSVAMIHRKHRKEA